MTNAMPNRMPSRRNLFCPASRGAVLFVERLLSSASLISLSAVRVTVLQQARRQALKGSPLVESHQDPELVTDRQVMGFYNLPDQP